VTVGEWLSARSPAPPEPLALRLREALGSHLADPSTETHDALLSTAESLLLQLLALDGAGRDRALDLLAVDALVTYSFEAATEDPDTLSTRATSAMTAISALATPAHRA